MNQSCDETAALVGRAPNTLQRRNRGWRSSLCARTALAPVFLVLALGAVLPPAAMAADPSDVTDSLPAPISTQTGANLNNGSGGFSAQQGAPGPQGGCATAIQGPLADASTKAVQNRITLAQSQLKPPGKILTGCITTLISLLSGLDIFSNLSVSGIAKQALNAVVSYGEQLVCDVISTEFNNVVSQAFNSVAFLSDIRPCGMQIGIPNAGMGGGGVNFCQIIGGPVITIGPGGTAVTGNLSSLTGVLAQQMGATQGGQVGVANVLSQATVGSPVSTSTLNSYSGALWSRSNSSLVPAIVPSSQSGSTLSAVLQGNVSNLLSKVH
jgi:hypothetical protein